MRKDVLLINKLCCVFIAFCKLCCVFIAFCESITELWLACNAGGSHITPTPGNADLAFVHEWQKYIVVLKTNSQYRHILHFGRYIHIAFCEKQNGTKQSKAKKLPHSEEHLTLG